MKRVASFALLAVAGWALVRFFYPQMNFGASQAGIERVSSDDLMSLVSTGKATPKVGAVLLLGNSVALNPARVVALLERRLRTIPRLRQRLEPVPFGCGRPVWVDDPDFKISDHVSILRCPVPGGRDAVLELASELLTTPLALNHALWTALLVTDVEDGRAALIITFHHVLADGVGGLAVLAGLVDSHLEPAIQTFPRPRPIRAQLMYDALRESLRAFLGFPAALVGAFRTLEQFAPALRTRLAPSSFNRPTGLRRRCNTVDCDLARVHELAHLHGATVNDVVLSAITGAIRRLLAGRQETADTFVISVPVSFRRGASSQKLGNQSAVVPVRLPATGEPLARLEAVARLTSAAKRTPPGASNTLLRPLFRLLSTLGLYERFINHQRLIHTFVTNVKGPENPLSLGGYPVLEIIPLVTAGGNVTVSFAVLSYAGRLTVSLMFDPDTCLEFRDLRGFLKAELELLIGPSSSPDSSTALEG